MRLFRSAGAFLTGVTAFAAALALAGNTFASLAPDEILLVVNANAPAGRQLAEFYAKARQLPADRIVAVSLPTPDSNIPPEETTPELYDKQVADPVREFLTSHKLQNKVRCIVTFWGMPLRISKRSITDAERREMMAVEAELDGVVRPQIEHEVTSIEGLALELDEKFPHPPPGTDIETLARRADAALTDVLKQLAAMRGEPDRRAALFTRVVSTIERLGGSAKTSERLYQPDMAALVPKPPTLEQVLRAKQELKNIQVEVDKLQRGPQTPDSRAKVRQLLRSSVGLVTYARALALQVKSFDTTSSEAALDSELACVQWANYPKSHWQPNPLFWRNVDRIQVSGPTMMVTRLDGPTVKIVHDMIETSIRAEQTGLRGLVALDARGRTATERDAYGQFDQKLRDLADLLINANPNLKVEIDNKEELFPANSLNDIAFYCGWYKLRDYTPPGRFVPGAVGYHVASSELVSLHTKGEKGWVHGLMNDGVTATLGPVAEPYLLAFPAPDEFFPLLMTGKLTLAEVYWRTVPFTSWMMTCIGDPLYTPCRSRQLISMTKLPYGLDAFINR